MEMINPEYRAENKGHYSPGVVSNGMLYISGQLSLDPDTRTVVEGGVEAHLQQALENMERVARAAGLSRKNVVQCRVFVADIENWDKVNEVYAQFFGEHKPARIVLPAGKLHFGCLVEVEAVAELK